MQGWLKPNWLVYDTPTACARKSRVAYLPCAPVEGKTFCLLQFTKYFNIAQRWLLKKLGYFTNQSNNSKNDFFSQVSNS